MTTQDTIKGSVDVVAGAGTVAALMEFVPAATAILSLVWVAIRIWETDTVKRWLGRGIKE